MDFREQSMRSIADRVNQGKVSAVAVVTDALDAIERLNPSLNAFCAFDPELALQAAQEVDAQRSKGAQLPLAGVPFGVKDLEDAAGYVTTFGSAFHVDDAPAASDSELVRRLRQAGAVVVGKTNTPEFGYKGKTDNVPFGATKNPWQQSRSPGGSSGGSAAALAAGMIPLATGSDGGGSIRIPAALCGLSGIKTSQGRMPNGGAKPTGSGLLTVKGPMTSRIRDAAFALDQCLGDEPTDIFSLPAPTQSWSQELDGRLPRAVIWSPTMGITTCDDEILSYCEDMIERLKAKGVRVIKRDEIWSDNPFGAWLVFWTSARARAQGHLRGTPEWEKIDAALRPQIEMGLDRFSGADYARAIDRCHTLNLELESAFQEAPILLTPATRGHAPTIEGDGFVNGEQTPDWVGYTMGINMTRNPAGTVPIGLSSDGLPIAMQVIGRQRDDLGVLKMVAAMEDLIGFEAMAGDF
ncbi:MAG: amidase [Pseudomonadales bacterium]